MNCAKPALTALKTTIKSKTMKISAFPLVMPVCCGVFKGVVGRSAIVLVLGKAGVSSVSMAAIESSRALLAGPMLLFVDMSGAAKEEALAFRPDVYLLGRN